MIRVPLVKAKRLQWLVLGQGPANRHGVSKRCTVRQFNSWRERGVSSVRTLQAVTIKNSGTIIEAPVPEVPGGLVVVAEDLGCFPELVRCFLPEVY